MKKYILFALLLVNGFVFSQTFRCGNEDNSILQAPGCDYFLTNTNSYCLNIKFHIVRNTDQSGGLNPNQIPAILALLNLRFNPHNISFVSLGYDYVNNSNYVNLPINNALSMFNTYDDTSALNYYAVNSTIGNGTTSASGFGAGIHCAVSNYAILGYTTPHEIGHCLGLKHTFECRYPTYDPSCAEILNDPNCQTRGDLVCDTPADIIKVQVQLITLIQT